jgi:HD-GYP domain-containing protein (c-di-GMP phosphodiesterase class II)
MTWETARDEIARNSGTQFDPQVVKVFLELFDEWVATGEYADRRRAA